MVFQNRSSAPVNSFATMMVNRSRCGAIQIICSWLCSKHTGRRGKGQCASNCRHFDPLLMQRAQWRRLPAGLRLAK